MKKIPFLDLRVTDVQEKKELLGAVNQVLTHGRIVLGPEVEKLEQKVALYCNRKYAVGVNSGTDALILGLKSLGVGMGDEVITTAMSWVATANAIALLGATPVFADVRDDLNIDPDSISRLITKKTKVIMPVHYTGRICQMDKILDIAKKNRIMVVEDAAQAFGATYQGQKAGSFGNVACFSMNPMKVYGALGEAGMIVTDDKNIYDKLTYLRYNGTINKEECISVSLNGRIDTIQAAMLLVRFKRFGKLIARRREIARYYNQAFAHIKGITIIPFEGLGEHNVYYVYTIRVERRKDLMDYLSQKGIETKIRHPILMSDQPVYQDCPKDKLVVANKIIQEIVSLPAHEKMSQTEINYVVKYIKEFYNDIN
jgi:dTDP-4-amino-4,6-dideoxygalactose transaminase